MENSITSVWANKTEQIAFPPADGAKAPKFHWGMNDSQLAKALGISRQAVWSARRRAKAPLSTQKWCQDNTYRTDILAIPVTKLTKMTVKEIAAEVGCSAGRVGCILRGVGIKPKPIEKVPRVKFPAVTNSRFWKKSNVEIAKLVGTTPGYVSLYRWRKGITSSKRHLEQVKA